MTLLEARGEKPCWCTASLWEGSIDGILVAHFPFCNTSLLLRHNLCLHKFTIAYINFPHVCAHRRTLSDLGGIQTQNVCLHVPHKRQGSWCRRTGNTAQSCGSSKPSVQINMCLYWSEKAAEKHVLKKKKLDFFFKAARSHITKPFLSHQSMPGTYFGPALKG